MDIRNKRLKGQFVLSVLIIAYLILTSAIIFSLPIKSAMAEEELDNGEIGELLSEDFLKDPINSSVIFDGKVAEKLFQCLTGDNKATISTIENIVNNGTLTSADFRAKNDENDLILTINNQRWMPVYLSKNKTGQPILTLWLESTTTRAVWNEVANNALGSYPNNLYGTCAIRSKTLNNGGTYARTNAATLTEVPQSADSEWAIYTMEKSSEVPGSIASFIEIPDNMDWQHDQRAKDYVKSTAYTGSYNYNNNNDALNYGGNTSTGDYSTNTKEGGYTAWAEDKIWLPSVAETGVSGEEGIWKTSGNQRSNTSYDTWLRSAFWQYYNTTYTLRAGGESIYRNLANYSNAVRPAFHLNLASVGKALGFAEPTDVTATYTGEDLTIANVSEEQIRWYNSSKMTLTYPDEMKDVDEYNVKVTLSGTDKFVGTPNTSIGESDKIRFFKFTIEKKKIGINITKTANGYDVQPKAGEVHSDDTGDRAPTFTVSYKNTITGKTYTEYPTELGSYFASVSITSDNYDLDENSYEKPEFTITARPIDDPKIVGSTTVTYSGDEYEFTVDNGDSDDVVITAPSDMNWSKSDKKLSVTNAGTYEVKVALADGGKATVWKERGGKTEYTLKIIINKATLTISFDDEIVWSWNSNSAKTVTFTDNRKKDNEELAFVVKYDTTTISDVTTSGKTTTIDIPPLSAKTYSLSVTLDDKTGSGGNYNISGGTQSFVVKDKEVSVSESNIILSYSNGGETTKLTSWSQSSTYELTYNAKDYIFSASLSGLDDDDGITISSFVTKTSGKEVTSGRDVATYTTTITLSSDVVKFTGNKTSVTFTFTWKINQGKYNLNSVTWKRNFDTDEFNGLYHVMTMDGLPETLTVTYSGNRQMNANTGDDKYKAVVMTINNMDSNYKRPVKNDPTTYDYDGDTTMLWEHEWVINKKSISLTWQSKLKTDENGKTFEYFEVSGEHADKIDANGYLYYNEIDYSEEDGALGASIGLDDIVVQSPIVKNYWVVATLKEGNYQNNYQITENKGKFFSVGSDKIEVAVELNNGNYEYIYDGNTHGEELTLSVDTLSLSNLVVKYYKDGEEEELSGAPSDSGNYKITLELTDDCKQDYSLIRNEITFEIKKATVKIDNNTAIDLYYNKAEQGLNLSISPESQNLPISIEDIVVKYYVKEGDEPIDGRPINADDYYVVLSLSDDLVKNYDLETTRFEMTIHKVVLIITTTTDKITYDGQTHEVEFSVKEKGSGADFDKDKIAMAYYKESILTENELKDELPKNARKYAVTYSLKDDVAINYEIEEGRQAEFEIEKIKIKAVWNTSEQIPVLSNLDEKLKGVVGYVYYDEEGNQLEEGATLEVGKSYKVKAILVGENASNYEFVTEDNRPILGDVAEAENLEKNFTITGNSGNNVGVGDGNEPEPTEPQPTVSIDIVQAIKDYWQPILCAICIIFIIIFMSKGVGFAGKRKKIKKTIEKKYNTAYYAVGGIGLFNLPYNTWTLVACIVAGVTVLAFIFMLLEKKSLGKAEDELDEARNEYEQAKEKKKEDEMRMMFMGMMGGNGQGGQGFAFQQGISADEMRMMLNDAVTAMLPNVTQYLPQQASTNDELMRKLEEQNEENEERIKKLNEENEERIEKLMQRLAEAQSTERAVASANANDEALLDLQASIKEMQKQMKSVASGSNINEDILEKLAVRLQPTTNSDTILKVVEKTEHNDETIKQLLKNQEKLMEKVIELSTAKPAEPQVIEKIVEKEVKVEVPVEKIVEVEKVVEKVVPMPVEKPAKTTKAPAQRLTLDEAYAKLSDKQKKIFDTLKAYAMSKDKCKEKKSTYFTILGQSTVNPLVKLTIKKNTTVAMFKMEDEFMKDIRRNATSDGTKVKVKETELIVGDNQALATAKEMIDLREDQIERYNEYLREQRSMKRK